MTVFDEKRGGWVPAGGTTKEVTAALARMRAKAMKFNIEHAIRHGSSAADLEKAAASARRITRKALRK